MGRSLHAGGTRASFKHQVPALVKVLHSICSQLQYANAKLDVNYGAR